MNTNAVAYKRIWDSVKKKYVKTKFHKDNPDMFKGGDVRIHPGAKKNSSKDAPKKKLTYEEKLAARKKAMRDRAAARNKQFKKDRANKKAGKKTSYEGYASAYDKRQAERKEALKIKAKKKHKAFQEARKKKKDVREVVKKTKKYNDKKYDFYTM